MKKIIHSHRRPLYLMLALILLCSHDLYLKMDSYFLQPNQEAIISLYNGTFEKSENLITRDRMLDASISAHGQRTSIEKEMWQDQDSTITQFPFVTGKPGTYVVGVSTAARNIALSGQDFNDYLEHDGVIDMLEQRKRDGTLEQDAVESYQKHVKAIYQVGDTKTDDWSTVLGYPIEFVPQANPYETYSGESIDVKVLLDGEPISNQLVYADYLTPRQDEHTHDGHTHTHDSGSEKGHTHTHGQELRTNGQGIVTVDLPEDGIYYLRTIHMIQVTDIAQLTHESKWATLTFEVSHEHGAHTHTHDNDVESHDSGIPTWVFIVASVLIIGLLFLVFRKKS